MRERDRLRRWKLSWSTDYADYTDFSDLILLILEIREDKSR